MRRPLFALLLAGLALTAWPAASHAATRTINFDDFTAPTLFADSEPLTERYAGMGVHFAGPAAGDGGAVLDVGSFVGVTGESEPNGLAFNTGATYTGGGVPRGPETITFDTPIHAASIRAGQNGGGTVRLTAFDGTTAVSTNFQTSQAMLQSLDVAAARITSLRLEFTGATTVWDDLTWSTSPVSGNDSFNTAFNTTLTVNAPGVLGNDTDADGDALTASLRRAPANGLVDLRPDGSFTYTPRAGFTGADTFDYRASDGTGNGNDATVTINVGAAPPPPPAEIPSTVSNSWLAFKKFTRPTRLRANKVLANSKIRVTCKTKRKKQQKKGCAKAKTIRKKSAAARVNLLKPYKKKKLPVGTKLTVTITTTGAIGKRFTFTVRKRKVPKLTLRCLPPGGKARKCS
jgi:hypothetical protein